MSDQILQCLALDDEPHALKILEAYAENTPFLNMKLSTNSVWEAMDLLKTRQVDLLFLDIQMDDLTGLQLLDLVGPKCPVILTTAYSEYALKGYEYQVVDYLLKPFSFDRFLRAVSRVKEAQDKSDHSPVVPAPKISRSSEAIFVKGDAKHKYHQIRLDSIRFVEGLKNYVRFNCTDQKVITLQNLKDILDDLPTERFIRIHKSYIVNLDFVQQVEGNLIRIDDQSIPIGGSYRTAFFERIK
jgi:DNA-binding LytR/AlgR family response regulator